MIGYGFRCPSEKAECNPIGPPQPFLFIGENQWVRGMKNLEVWLFYSHCQINLKALASGVMGGLALVLWFDGFWLCNYFPQPNIPEYPDMMLV